MLLALGLELNGSSGSICAATSAGSASGIASALVACKAFKPSLMAWAKKLEPPKELESSSPAFSAPIPLWALRAARRSA